VLPVFDLSVKFEVNTFMDDRYMAILRLRGFGCEMPIRPILGSFGVKLPQIVKSLI